MRTTKILTKGFMKEMFLQKLKLYYQYHFKTAFVFYEIFYVQNMLYCDKYLSRKVPENCLLSNFTAKMLQYFAVLATVATFFAILTYT